jgi:hypothetical protein
MFSSCLSCFVISMYPGPVARSDSVCSLRHARKALFFIEMMLLVRLNWVPISLRIFIVSLAIPKCHLLESAVAARLGPSLIYQKLVIGF